MKTRSKSRSQVSNESSVLSVLRQRIRELESAETERERVEEELRHERDKAQMYLDVAGVAIVVIDAHEKTALVNRRGCELLGYSEKELIGKNWFEVCVPVSIRDDTRSLFHRLLFKGLKAWDYYESRVLTKQGD